MTDNPTPPAEVDVAEGRRLLDEWKAADAEWARTSTFKMFDAAAKAQGDFDRWCYANRERLLTAAEQVASLRSALQKAPLPSMSGSAAEFYQRFFDWLKNDVEPALERSALGAAP